MGLAIARELLGQTAEVFHKLMVAIEPEILGTEYCFMEEAKFQQLLVTSLSDGQRVYFEEILYRAHLATATNILRHKRWHNACLKLYDPEPNFLGFVASLRGLLESATDAYYSLASIPLTLAENHSAIEVCLAGQATSVVLSQELENVMIHFQFARKLDRAESAPDAHRAESVSNYIKAADGEETKIKEMYAELCQIVHPAMPSLMWMVDGAGESGFLTGGSDKDQILNLIRKHSVTIDLLYVLGLTPSIMILKVLNRFSMHQLQTQYVNNVNMRDSPVWLKIQNAFSEPSAEPIDHSRSQDLGLL